MTTFYQTPTTISKPLGNKQLVNKNRHAFLLTFFDLPHEYSHKEVNGFILVRQFNSNNQQWEVAIYTKDKWKQAEEWKQKQSLF
jgi:hypothetical protein